MDHPLYDYYKKAVQKYGMLLEHIDIQTDELCMLAIQQNPSAFKFVRNQTDEICKLAIELCTPNFAFVKNKTPDLCKMAVQKWGGNLQFVPKEQRTMELIKLALDQDIMAIIYINRD